MNPAAVEVESDAALAAVGFADLDAAVARLQRIGQRCGESDAWRALLPNLLRALPAVADPDGVLVYVERLAFSFDSGGDLAAVLAGDPRAIEQLVALFAGSRFLSEILLRRPAYLALLARPRGLARVKSPGQYYVELQAAAADSDWLAATEAVLRFQRRELLRIGACDLFGMFDLATVTRQLSVLADSVIQRCLALAAAQTRVGSKGFVVLALGKLGGRELNYSSDIDLLFLCSASPGRHIPLAQRLVAMLSEPTPEGFLYRVDLRLRPWGRAGPLVSTSHAYLHYLTEKARPWELQALLKARPVAGNLDVGNAFLESVAGLHATMTADDVREAVRAMRQKTEEHLRQKGREWGEVKLGAGSIRDVEFAVQLLQLAHGARQPELRERGTLDAIERLAAAGHLSPTDRDVLASGYTFMRTIEHYLQLLHYRQTHTLPRDEAALSRLAERLGFRGAGGGADFVRSYEEHSAAIRSLYRRHIEMEEHNQTAPHGAGVARHLRRMTPTYTDTFDDDDVRQHARMAARLHADNLVEVLAEPLPDGNWRITIVAYDYFGELSMICGLFVVYGISIVRGSVFTYEPISTPSQAEQHALRAPRRTLRVPRTARGNERRKIVDVFTVRSVRGGTEADTWPRYSADLHDLLRQLDTGAGEAARGSLARRFAETVREVVGTLAPLAPVDVEADNEASDSYTLLRIEAPDTFGFLYEIATALAINRIYIARVDVDTTGQRVFDVLYVTDTAFRKISDPARLRELRTAIVLVKHFTHLLPHAPNPEAALLHFRNFLGQLFMRPDWPSELASLDRPEVLDALARLLGVSDFLWEDFLRMQHDNLFPVVTDVEGLAEPKPHERLRAELAEELRAAAGHDERVRTLNDFKDREMFRIDMRYILRRTAAFTQFAHELSDLAEVVVAAACDLARSALQAQHGEPRLPDGAPCSLAVCALGKAGGRELGFASDIELMFVYAGNGVTDGAQPISNAEFFERLVQGFVGAIRAKQEGIFEVDLRLRPYGTAGSMAVALESFRRYFAPDGPAWDFERQALVRLRPIAGDLEFGQRLLVLRDECVYTGEPFDGVAMRAMRERQLRHLVTPGALNVKYSPGGLVDAEYLVQGLQITHGDREPALRIPNIVAALAALAEAGVVEADEQARLTQAYVFLRDVINALRVVRGHARDMTVPERESEEFAFLARRLRYGRDRARLHADLQQQMEYVLAANRRLLD